MNYPGYPESLMYELKIEGHIARNWGQKFRGHVTDFKTNQYMSLISMHIEQNPAKKNIFMNNSG